MFMLIPVLSFNVNWLNKLPEDVKTTVIAYANLTQEKGIYPLLESSKSDFEANFVQAGSYFYIYIFQISSIIESRYQNQDKDITLDMAESFFEGLDAVRKDFSKYSNESFFLLLMDSTYVIENFIRLFTMSTFALHPQYYIKAFEAFINISVCISSLLSVKTNASNLKPEIRNLLNQKFEDNTKTLNDLVENIQIEEDKKAVMEGRQDYTNGKIQTFSNMDEVLKTLKSS